mgnify:CR=1 FL=1
MKIFLLTVCLLVFIFRSTAQEVDEKAFYQQRFEKFKRIKNLGIGLTAVGGVALAVGLVLHANNDRQDFTSNPYSYQKEEGLSTGEVTAIGSLFLIGPGIPLCIVGSQGESKYKAKLRTVSLIPSIKSQRVAITLRFKL